MGSSVETDSTSGTKIEQTSGQPNIETCKRLLRDFPTAFDNYKICKKVEEAGQQYLDWLRVNRNLCESSKDHFTAFTTNNCGSVWCGAAGKKIQAGRRNIRTSVLTMPGSDSKTARYWRTI